MQKRHVLDVRPYDEDPRRPRKNSRRRPADGCCAFDCAPSKRPSRSLPCHACKKRENEEITITHYNIITHTHYATYTISFSYYSYKLQGYYTSYGKRKPRSFLLLLSGKFTHRAPRNWSITITADWIPTHTTQEHGYGFQQFLQECHDYHPYN